MSPLAGRLQALLPVGQSWLQELGEQGLTGWQQLIGTCLRHLQHLKDMRDLLRLSIAVMHKCPPSHIVFSHSF